MIIKLKKPVYYWSRYWQKWDEIIGWNKDTNYLVLKEIGTNKVREHFTSLNKNCLSTEIVNGLNFIKLRPFYEKIEVTASEAYNILIQCGVPTRMFI